MEVISDHTREKSARTQRQPSVHENDSPSRQPRIRIDRRNHSWDDISSDSDSRISSSVRVRPGLKFPFNFKQTMVEKDVEKDVLAAAEPRVIRESDRREAREHRRRLYHENIQSFVHSRYAGDVHERGDPTIDLFTKGPQEDKEDGPTELMTWIQTESQYPNLESFLDYVSHLDCLEEAERKSAVITIGDVRDQFEKPLPMPGKTVGKYLQPNVAFRRFPLSDDTSGERDISRQEVSVIWLCLPYFWLAPYSTSAPLQKSSSYPLRTLLQSWHMSTPKNREMQQAICDLDYPKEDYVIHVPQFWCLLIGDKTLITCKPSQSAEPKWSWRRIRIQPAPSYEDQPHLRVSDGGTRVWLLAVTSCITWLEFIAHFWELSLDFDNAYEILHANEPQDASTWPLLIERAQKTTVRLRLRSKILAIDDYSDESCSSLDSSSVKDDSSTSDVLVDSGYIRRASRESEDPLTRQPGHALSTAPGTTQELPDNPGPVQSTSETTSKRPSQSAPSHTELLLLASNKKTIFSWFAAVFSDISTKHAIKNTEINQQDQKLDVYNDDKLDKSFSVDGNKIADTLTAMHSSLCTSEFKKHREYRKCPNGTIQEVNAKLTALTKEYEQARRKSTNGDSTARHNGNNGTQQESDRVPYLFASTSDSEEVSPRGRGYHRLLERKRKFVRIMKKLFSLFLPLSYTSEMVAKYWGAVDFLLQNQDTFSPWLRSIDSRKGFPHHTVTRDTWHCNSLIESLDQIRATVAHDFILREGLIESWAHLTMFLVLSTMKQHREAFNELVKFRHLAYGSRAKLMRSLAQRSLHRREAVLPLGVTSMIVKDLLRDVTDGLPDISRIYFEAYDKLRQQILSKPYSHEHQEKAARLRQEMGCIYDVLQDQLGCVIQLLQRDGRGAVYTPPAFEVDSEHSILPACESSIRARIQKFAELNDDAGCLSDWNMKHVESTNDRHEAAILILTAVTVIFLPLSFISSIFGMNTADIRHTNKGQWAFWVSAILVTITVSSLSLFTYRHFRPVLQALDHFWHLKGYGKQEGDDSSSPRFVDASYGQRGQRFQLNVFQNPAGNRPTYIRVHRKYMCPETLDTYELPWEWDHRDSDYLIIKRWIPENDQDILFEHSRKLREARRIEAAARRRGLRR